MTQPEPPMGQSNFISNSSYEILYADIVKQPSKTEPTEPDLDETNKVTQLFVLILTSRIRIRPLF